MGSGNPHESSLGKERLEALVGEAIVDCYNETEQIVGLFTMIEENLGVPFGTLVLGHEVRMERVELRRHNEIVAICSRGQQRQAIGLLDLPLPSPRPAGAEWIEAYRYWYGER